MPDWEDWTDCNKHMLTYRGNWCPACRNEAGLPPEPRYSWPPPRFPRPTLWWYVPFLTALFACWLFKGG